jgi:hypothetical protein
MMRSMAEPTSKPNVELVHDAQHDLASALFVRRVVERGLPELRADSWTTAAVTLEPVGEPVQRFVSPGSETVLVEVDGVLAQVGLCNGWAQAHLAGRDENELARVLGELKRVLPAPDPDSSHEVTVVFWTYTPHGPMPGPRTIAVPEWSDIEDNYARATRARLAKLMRGFEPAHGGQLVLWHGKAGTGKTFALRALAWEWREWCDLHYIVDPDSFFGEHADYLMNVLLQPGYEAMAMSVGINAAMPELEEEEQRQEKSWRLLVLEDTGELLTPDAKTVIGQGLSRFLNVVDGLIGQGLRVLVLVTTNEPIKRLHPAVARPGRCAANVEFHPLAADEASDWLRQRGVETTAEGPELLASLYARLEGAEAVEAEQAAGFSG